MKIQRLFFDLNGLEARTLRVVAALGSTRAVGVFRSLKAQGVSMSYPGVVKRLKTMCEQGLLTKDGMKYSISAVWLSEMKELFTELS